MTQKDYILIAKTLISNYNNQEIVNLYAYSKSRIVLLDLIKDFIVMFKVDNSSFKPKLFRDYIITRV